MRDNVAALVDKIVQRKARIGVIGLGYVGLPLAIAFADEKFPVIGFDVDEKKVDSIQKGECYLKHLKKDVTKIEANIIKPAGCKGSTCPVPRKYLSPINAPIGKNASTPGGLAT